MIYLYCIVTKQYISMHVYSNTYILINKTCNLCTAYYVQYWPPTRELPLQIPMAQSIMETHKWLWRCTSSHSGLPQPTSSMPYVHVPDRPFAVRHINNIISNILNVYFPAILEYTLWSVSPLSTSSSRLKVSMFMYIAFINIFNC